MQHFLTSIKILFLLIVSNFVFINIFAFNENSIDPNTNSIISVGGSGGFDLLDNIFSGIIDHIFGVLAVILIGVFIYVGYLFITSSGDEAQFKKAWKTFVYAIIGIVIIILSYSVIKLISTIGI
ncbi:MAG: hypothetical protein WC850_03515 [Candidatus Gracilibacteria bacterium]